MASADPVNSQYSYGPGGTVNSSNFSLGGLHTGNLMNPGAVDPSSANPYAAQTLASLHGLQGDQQQILNDAFDPNHYNALKSNAITGQTTGIDNSYAKMGLAGSSANLGADQSAINQTNMQFYNRQMGDQQHAIQGMQGLDQTAFGDTMGIQSQYSGYQNNMMQMLMGLQNSSNQQANAENQMYGSIIGGGLGAAGMGLGAYFAPRFGNNNNNEG